MPGFMLSCHLTVCQCWDDEVFGVRTFTLEQHRVVQWVAQGHIHQAGTVGA